MNDKKKKPKILLLGDDLRMFSGIATMSREFVIHSSDKIDWVQLGGAMKHPQKGQAFDLSAEVNKIKGIDNAYVKVYCVEDYGTPDLIRHMMATEKPDAILHFTDPRYWEWLYAMDHEIRQQIPLLYYNIWDDTPDPLYNSSFYASCDGLFAISKQTYGINKRVLAQHPFVTLQKQEKYDAGISLTQVTYNPHGVDPNIFFPIEFGSLEWSAMEEYKQKLFGGKEYNFVVFFNSRNLRRKRPADLIVAFEQFINGLSAEQREKCVLVMHTLAVDGNGTNLKAVKEALAPLSNVIFSENQITQPELNYLYNIADVTALISSNEGFGISPLESVMASTPTIVTVTGGLQDQCGLQSSNTEKEFTPDEYIKIETLADKPGRVYKHGSWTVPVWPAARVLQGSLPTPYIWDDICTVGDVAAALRVWYGKSRVERKAAGLEGRNYMINKIAPFTAQAMGARMAEDIQLVLDTWTPKKKFTVYKV